MVEIRCYFRSKWQKLCIGMQWHFSTGVATVYNLAYSDHDLFSRNSNFEYFNISGFVWNVANNCGNFIAVVHFCLPMRLGFTTFTYQELTQMTGSWDDRPVSDGGRRLGEGGFGIVFKGFFSSAPVAVKKLNLVGIGYVSSCYVI